MRRQFLVRRVALRELDSFGHIVRTIHLIDRITPEQYDVICLEKQTKNGRNVHSIRFSYSGENSKPQESNRKTTSGTPPFQKVQHWHNGAAQFTLKSELGYVMLIRFGRRRSSSSDCHVNNLIVTSQEYL
jgi:hypothetical protein